MTTWSFQRSKTPFQNVCKFLIIHGYHKMICHNHKEIIEFCVTGCVDGGPPPNPLQTEDINAEITVAVDSISRVTLADVTDRLNMFSAKCTGFKRFTL
jgi:hypothetical protein